MHNPNWNIAAFSNQLQLRESRIQHAVIQQRKIKICNHRMRLWKFSNCGIFKTPVSLHTLRSRARCDTKWIFAGDSYAAANFNWEIREKGFTSKIQCNLEEIAAMEVVFHNYTSSELVMTLIWLNPVWVIYVCWFSYKKLGVIFKVMFTFVE